MMSPPRHVLMTADAVGGVWTYALDLAEGLIARDVAVTLAVMGPSASADQTAAAERVGARVIETGLTLDWMEEAPHRLTASSRSVSALAAEVGADLIHLNSPILAADAAFGAPVVGVAHSCLASWWGAVRGGAMPDGFRWRTERLARGYAACDRLIAPSRAFADQTAALYGVMVETMRNGQASDSEPVMDKASVAITAGRLWDAGKNLAALDRAAGRMRGRVEAAGPLVGPHGEEAGCEAVFALGRLSRDDLDHRLRQSAVFVSPALYEPFGLGVLEAARGRCALVLSDIATFRELWDGAAVFVDPGDDRALALLLDDLLTDPDRCARLGALAARRAGRYSAKAMVEGVLAVYAQAMSARAAPLEQAA